MGENCNNKSAEIQDRGDRGRRPIAKGLGGL